LNLHCFITGVGDASRWAFLKEATMKVFLSSTYIDLIEHRRQAAEALERLGQQAGRMEVFGARPEEPQEACLREIDACDIFVGIYAHRYGYLPQGSERSITESEFRHAKSSGKPIFCFVVDEQYPWPPPMIEDEPGRTKLRAFKTEIGTSLVRETFTSPENLALKLATSVGRYITQLSSPLGGVVNGLKDLIKEKASISEADRQAIADALSSAVAIANRTLQYIAQQRRSGHSNVQEETELSKGWADAGLKLVNLPHPEWELADRYFAKAEYWSYPDMWTDERIDAARIGLEEISQESRAVLLGLKTPKPSLKRTRKKPRAA
jgi:hypothetical protein